MLIYEVRAYSKFLADLLALKGTERRQGKLPQSRPLHRGDRLMFAHFKSDLEAILSRDPAARGWFSSIFIYPSFHVLLFYRLSHGLWRLGLRGLPRWLMQIARWLTGIEIHPGAKIGKAFFIDHGMGVVIGETAEIGDYVTLYHGVTLGGTNPSENSAEQRGQKRHPTLGDYVIIGAGASVLGPVTVARCARVGSNSVVTKDIAQGVTVVGVPARPIPKKRADERFNAYGVSENTQDDPRERVIQLMGQEIEQLRQEMSALRAAVDGTDKVVPAQSPKPSATQSVEKK